MSGETPYAGCQRRPRMPIPTSTPQARQRNPIGRWRASSWLGATSNALASKRELTARFGPAPRAFLIVPIVGAFLIDFTNALVTTLALNLLR